MDGETKHIEISDESSDDGSIVKTLELKSHANDDDYTDDVDLTASISCTACHCQINIKKPGSFNKHPLLQVLICRSCFKWYTSGKIEQDSDGFDEQCRWCGQGGRLVLCDFCHNAFCKDCVKQNLGQQELSAITAEGSKWHCYVCNPAPLKGLVTRCVRLHEVLKQRNSVALQSTNQMSNTDVDGNCASFHAPTEGAEECFITGRNVDSLADELYSECNAWIKKLAQLRSSLKNTCSKEGTERNHMRDDMARKFYQHFKTLENCLSRIKKKGQKAKDAEDKRERKRKEKGGKQLDIDLSGNDLEVMDSKVDGKRSLSDEKSRLNCNGNVNCNYAADDIIDTEMQSEDCPNEQQCRVTENCVVITDDLSANAKIRLKISLPKLNKANVEAQHLLHLEELESGDKSESENKDLEPKVGGRKGEKSKKKQVNAEDVSHELKDEEEEEAEEIESAPSSDEEYNPKQDLRDLKSEMRQQRREHLKKLKTKAAKHSLEKIKEAVQRRRARAKEAEEEESKREAKKEDRKVKKEGKNKKGLPAKQSADAGNHPQRKSERLTKDKQKQKESEEEEEEEEEDDKDSKEAKAAQMKSKSSAKVSDEATKENEDASNDEDDLVKKIDVKNVKTQKEKRGSTSNEEICECKKIDELDTKEAKKTVKKKQKNVDVTNEDTANDDGRNSESEVIIEEKKHLENVPKSKSSVSFKLKNRLDARGANNEEAKGKGKNNKGRKGTLVDEQSSDIIEGDKAEENECEQASEEDRIVADDDLIVLDDNNDDDDDDVRSRNALAEESDGETSCDADDGGGGGNDDDDDDDDEDKDDSIKKEGKANAPQSPGVCLLDDSESEGFGKVKKKQKLADLPGVTLLSSDEDFEIKKSRGNKKKTKKKTDGSLDEDSDEECIVTKRQKKKRKHQDSSLESEESDSDPSSKKKKSKKRRRRIKSSSSTENEDENEEGSADDFQSPQGKKRKKIHKIIGDKKLSRQTLDAAKAEEERRQRISDRQKLFNQVIVEDTASPTKCPITTKLVLEADEETKEPIIEVHRKLICKLKPHQVEAIKFMWNCCVESLERLEADDGSGCILAHCMGLGKTLSVITFVHTLLRYKKLTKMKTCLVLCPLNTILNWDSEFDRWLTDISSLDVYELSTVKDNWGRSEVIKNWQEGGGVLIMGYEMFRTLSQLSRVKNKKQKKIFTEGLHDPGPDLIVCDEGHVLKNDATGLSKACNQIRTRRRVVLTGTPLQNNLIEYHCMVAFVKPNLLGTRKEFFNRFVNPITNGQCSDSTLHDVKTMKRRAHILHETLAGCVQRKDYSALTQYLLPKHEYVILIRLSKVQIELYEKYLQKLGEDICAQAIRGSRIFTDYQNLMKIWTHPWVLKLDEIRQETKKIYKDDGDSFIDDSECESEMSFNSKSSKSGGETGFADEDDWRPKRVTRGAAKKQKEESAKEKITMANGTKDEQDDSDKEEKVIKGWKTRSRGGGGPGGIFSVNEEEQVGDKEEEEDEGYRVSSEWWADYIKPSDQFNLEISGKLMLLAEILKMSESIGDKVLVFSQSLLSLDLIENFLAHWDKLVAVDADKQVAGTQGWDRGVDYIRMDGSTSAQNRRDWTVMFNDEANAKARLFLISTKAGSLGINLVAANRVIIFDASWNPTHDVQSIFRVYRFGQTKPVYVYRFLAQGTMEEKIYERQVMKQSLSQRVIDEHQIERHFTAADLKELYVFKPDRIDDPNQPERPTPKLPKDRMLAELLTNHKDLIVQYHEHDSLLENKVEEELSEEERKTAWEEYEQEKKGLRPLPASYQYSNMAAAAMMQNLYNQPAANPMSSYIPDAHKIAQAIYAADPGISEADLKQRVQFYLQMQLVNQQRAFLAQQQKQQEAEKMQRMQEEWYRQQLMLQQFGYGSSRSDTSGTAKLDQSSLPATGATASQSTKSSNPKGSGGRSTAQPSSSSE